MRHARYYLTLLAEIGETYQASDVRKKDSLLLFERERTQIETAQRWSAEQSTANFLAAEVCSDFCNVHTGVLTVILSPAQRLQWAEDAAAAAAFLRIPDVEKKHLHVLADACLEFGETERSIELLRRALAVPSTDVPDGPLLNTLASAYARMGEFEQASKYLTNSGEMAQGDNDQHAVLLTHLNRAALLSQSGHMHEALAALEKLLERSQEYAEHALRGMLLMTLAAVCLSLGQLRRASPFLKDALSDARSTGDSSQEASVLIAIGRLEHGTGEFARARECYEAAADILRRRDEPVPLALAYWDLSVLLDRMGRHDDATTYMEESRQLLERAGDRRAPEAARQLRTRWKAMSFDTYGYWETEEWIIEVGNTEETGTFFHLTSKDADCSAAPVLSIDAAKVKTRGAPAHLKWLLQQAIHKYERHGSLLSEDLLRDLSIEAGCTAAQCEQIIELVRNSG